MNDATLRRLQGTIVPDGTAHAAAGLPPPQTQRWVMRRKVEVLAAVRSGVLSIEDACRRYSISMEEFLAWKNAMDRFGPPGLSATRTFRGEPPECG